MKSYTIKENHISSVVSEILRYRQTDSQPFTFLYIRSIVLIVCAYQLVHVIVKKLLGFSFLKGKTTYFNSNYLPRYYYKSRHKQIIGKTSCYFLLKRKKSSPWRGKFCIELRMQGVAVMRNLALASGKKIYKIRIYV